MNVMTIKTTASKYINKIASNTYAGGRLLNNRVLAKDTFNSEYTKKIVDKAKSDFSKNKVIRGKMYGSLGIALFGLLALITTRG